jgi:hypothetical protein
MRWTWGIPLALTLGVGALLVAAGSAETTGETRPWRELPAPPLSPRELPTGFWTGSEVVLVGGSDAPPCSPTASCRPPTTPPLADGAAFDPKTGTWRPIAEAPVAFSWAAPAVVGSTAYLHVPGEPWRPDAPSAFLAYRIDEDRWEELPVPTSDPGASFELIPGEGRLFAYDSSGHQPTRAFDLAAKSWSEIPDDSVLPRPVDPWADAWETVAGVLAEAEARYYVPRGLVLDTSTGSWIRMPELEAIELAYGGTTDIAAGRDLFVFLGSEWSTPQGRLHSRAWLWSPDG